MELKIAAAYVRVSTDDQLEYSPDSQLKIIREHAKRDGYVIPEEYIFREEDGISGKSAEKRPAFRLMIATAKETPAPFEAIFVWKFSRFARNQEEAIMYKNLLSKRGISVRSISEPSTDSPFSSLIERIIEWMDEYYLINLAGEVRRGMNEKHQRGEVTGAAPYGYKCEEKKLVPVPEEADVIRYIFERYAAGEGHRKIARELDEMGVKTKRGNVPDNRFVQYILANPVYIGSLRRAEEGHANYSRASYNGDKVTIIEHAHEAIISAELWEAAQKRSSERSAEAKYVRKQNPRMYMLKGLIRCDCGATLTMSASAQYLQCHSYARGQCSVSHSIMIHKADALTISALNEIIESDSYHFAEVVKKVQKPGKDWAKLIASERSKLTRARDAFLNGVFTDKEYLEVKASAEEIIAKLEAAQAAEEVAATAPTPSRAAFREKALAVLEIIKSPDVTAEAKNEALRTIIDHITYHKPENTLDFYFIS